MQDKSNCDQNIIANERAPSETSNQTPRPHIWYSGRFEFFPQNYPCSETREMIARRKKIFESRKTLSVFFANTLIVGYEIPVKLISFTLYCMTKTLTASCLSITYVRPCERAWNLCEKNMRAWSRIEPTSVYYYASTAPNWPVGSNTQMQLAWMQMQVISELGIHTNK